MLDQTRQYRDALGLFATGVTIVTTLSGRRCLGLTVNSFNSVSLEPPLILWSLRVASPLFPDFRTAPFFAVNVLAADQAELSRRFASMRAERFAGLAFGNGLGDCPIIPGSVAVFECRRQQCRVAGDHAIFLGKVERFSASAGSPLVYCQGKYVNISQIPMAASR